MNEDIIRMARESGFNWPEIHTTTIEERLTRFAALVRADEREACAVAGAAAAMAGQDYMGVAATIRARSGE